MVWQVDDSSCLSFQPEEEKLSSISSVLENTEDKKKTR